MPEGDLGRIILAIAPSKPSTMYAMIESKESGLYRSDDNGDNWKKMSNAVSVTARPFYFSCLYVDPFNENKVYRPSFQLGFLMMEGKPLMALVMVAEIIQTTMLYGSIQKILNIFY